MKLTGLIAAAHTPFTREGSLNLEVVPLQANHLEASGVSGVFVGGSTGESHSLTLQERLALADAWCQALQGSPMQFIVHVGGNCLEDAAQLAAQAQDLGAAAIAALSPSYFKPSSLDSLVACCSHIANAAHSTPFYFYDIPALTGVNFSMPAFLRLAQERIPTFAGIKYTNPDLMAYQLCLQSGLDIPWGVDETLVAALALGAQGAVGSSYNFAASIYLDAIDAMNRADFEAARAAQMRSVSLIGLLAGYGYMAAAKEVMDMLGVPVGPPRLPHLRLTSDASAKLRTELEQLGFFKWI